jgi:hypothetical protein
MVVIVMPRQEEKHEGKETRFEVSADMLAMLVFEHLMKEGNLPEKKHKIALHFHADSEVCQDTRITGATFIAKEQM